MRALGRWWITAFVAVASCGGGATTHDAADAGAAVDMQPNGDRADAVSDVGADGAIEAGTDTIVDVAADVGADGIADTVADTVRDAVADALTGDTGADGGPDLAADVGASDRPPDLAADVAGDAAPDAIDAPIGGDGGPDASGGGPDSERICGAEGWCWVYPPTQGNRLNGVWAAARNDVWAVGEWGTILRFDGQRWRQVPSGTRAHLNAVWGSGPNDVWIVGELDTVKRWNGTTLETMRQPNFSTSWFGISGTGPDDVWLSQAWRAAAHWDGTRWDTGASANTDFWGQSIWAMSRGEAWISTYQGYAVRATYSASGNSVSYQVGQLAPTGTNLDEVWGANAQDSWIGGAGDIIYHRTGTGNTFTAVDPATSGDIHGIWGTATNNVWAVGGGGAIVRWDGTRFSAVTSPTRMDLNDVWGTAADDIWAVGDAGIILHWDGRAWTGDGRPTEMNLRDVWVTAPDDIWAVGDRGTIIRSRDGNTFSPVASPTTQNLTRIWGATPTSIWMVGDNGTVIEWDGSKFTSWSLPAQTLLSVWGTSRNDIWAAGLYLFHFDGSRWSQLPLFEPGHSIFAAWTNDPDRVFMLAGFDTFYDYQPSTGRWTKMMINGDQLIWGTGPDDLWISGSPGDGGHFDGMTWSWYRTDDMYDLWGSGRDHVWGVGFYGLIAHRAAGATLWETQAQNQRMTTNDLYGLHGSSATDVFAVGEFGMILRKKR